MDFINNISALIVLCTFGLTIYAVVRWLSVLIANPNDHVQRKKYAKVIAVSMVVIGLLLIISFVLNYNHNQV